MATLQGWVHVDPTSGSGNKSISVSAQPYTGRVSRTATLTIKSANLADKTVAVTQKGKPLYISGSDSAMDKNSTEITITGYSNAAGLKFTEGTTPPVDGTDLLDIDMPYGYDILGISRDPITNGAEIPGDPGAYAEYEWSLKIVADINTSVKARSVQIIVSDYRETVSKTITISQSAGDPYLTVSVSSLELEYTGAAKTFNIQSNTSWTIS